MLAAMFALFAVTLALCPDPARHEQAADCPWAAVARTAETGDAPRVLAETAPTIWRDAARDRAARALHEAWGTSRNFDEHAKAVIVAPSIAAALGDRLGVKIEGDVLHAGLQHTYGYLFSTLWTSFGYKRARWVDGALERGLALPVGTLGPKPRAGTLYANVTCALARLAFDDASWQALASTCARSAASEVLSLHARPHDTIVEHAGDVTLRTELVPLDAGHSLLVYTQEREGRRVLLTSFPVDEVMAASVRALPTGEGVPVAARYNAVVPGLAQPVTGSRARVTTK